MNPRKYFVTTPIYYVNDQPHIGHAYTTVSADVLARQLRLRYGTGSVFSLTGTDEHGSKVAEKAASLGKEPKVFTDEVAQQFKDAWHKLDVAYDHFIRTTDDYHEQRVQKILNQLKDATTPAGNSAIYESVYKGLYCVGCERFLTQKELVDGKCPDHKTVPKELEEKNWFFRLSDYLPHVREKIEKGELHIYPTERKNETLGLFEQGIDDFSISRSTVTWGVPLPWDESQKAYVWVDALANYITALGYPDDTQRVQDWWTEGEVIQLMAMDILKFHAVYWPALLLALGLPVPNNLYIHGFFTIDGQKMSKTLGNVIRPGDLVDRYGADATRYLILSQFSFGYESDIKVQEFDTKYNADLANGMGNLLARVTNMVEKYFDGNVGQQELLAVKRGEHTESNIDRDAINLKVVVENDAKFLDAVGDFVTKLRFREGLLLIWQKIGESNQLIDREKPWTLAETEPEKLKIILRELVGNLYVIAQALQPFMPTTAAIIEESVSTERIVKKTGLFAKME